MGVVPNITSGGQRTMKDIQRANVELDKVVEQLREQIDNLQKDLQKKEIANVALETQLHEQVEDLQGDLHRKDDELNSLRVTDGVRWMFQEGPHWIAYEPAKAAEIEAAHTRASGSDHPTPLWSL